MPIREACVFAVQRLTEDDRADFGCLVLAMRKRMQYLKSEVIHVWVPDAGPSEQLLGAVQETKKRLMAASTQAKKVSFRRACLTWESLNEWEQFWFAEFAPQYRRELHGRETCRVVTYGPGKERTDHTYPLSPIDYILSLEQQQAASGNGIVTLMCCEPNQPEKEECHRHILLADILTIQSIRLSLSHADHVRLKVRVRGELPVSICQTLVAGGIDIKEKPYSCLGETCLYAVTVHTEDQARNLFAIPLLETVEPMPIIMPAVVRH
jgi:hypothetical protein